MKVFITGGAGFIGANIADHYLSRGVETVVYDNLSRQGVEKNLAWLKKKYPKIHVEKADIRDFHRLRKSLHASEILYHMASQVAVTTSVKDPRTDFEVNALGTLNVLEAARAQRNPPIIIYASTNKVYGALSQVKVKERKLRYELANPELKDGIDETFLLDFHSPYGCSKGTGDQYTHDYARIYGLPTIVFRQSCIYGIRQFGNEDQGWVAHFARRAMTDKAIAIYGNGKQVRDILYISDLIDCFLKAIDKIDRTKGEIFNIGGGKGNSLSLIELIKILETKLKKKIRSRRKPWRPGDQLIYISDNAKAKKVFGWSPKIDVSTGLTNLISWLEKLPA